jgi:hypothetical protein
MNKTLIENKSCPLMGCALKRASFHSILKMDLPNIIKWTPPYFNLGKTIQYFEGAQFTD